MRLFTWLDVQRQIQKETFGGRGFPEPIPYFTDENCQGMGRIDINKRF